MKLTPHVETLRTGLANAASLGDETTQDIARRLGGALDNSARLALISAISEATAEISTELAPGSVELRMSGDEPQFAVHVPQNAETPTVLTPPEPVESTSPEAEQATTVTTGEADETTESVEEEPQVRVSLRLPASVKSRVDEAADTERISTNAWLVRAIQNALAPPRSTSPESSSDQGAQAGWFGPQGPFGPDGPFGPNGVFGDNGPFGKNPHRGKGTNRESTVNVKGSNVKGWVK